MLINNVKAVLVLFFEDFDFINCLSLHNLVLKHFQVLRLPTGKQTRLLRDLKERMPHGLLSKRHLVVDEEDENHVLRADSVLEDVWVLV
jgi:hypothetical protein